MQDTPANPVTAAAIHAAFANESEQFSELVEDALDQGAAETLYDALALCDGGQQVSELFWEISNILNASLKPRLFAAVGFHGMTQRVA